MMRAYSRVGAAMALPFWDIIMEILPTDSKNTPAHFWVLYGVG
jgi:hypothetical protein